MSVTSDPRPPAPPAPPWVDDGRQPPEGGDPPPRQPKRPPVVAGTTLLAVGGLWLLHVLGVTIPWGAVLPSALIAVGLAVLVGGRRPVTAGLVTLGTVLAIVAILVAVLPGTSDLSTGERTHVVTELGELEERYELGAGDLTIDLREVALPAGETDLVVRVGAGQLAVVVPPDVTVVVEAEVGLGELVAFDQRVGGVTPRRTVTEEGDPGAGTLRIEASVGLGQLEVTR
jgi:hypothetical protein